MAWLKRLFGIDKPQQSQAAQGGRNIASQVSQAVQSGASAGNQSQTVPPERMGLNGEYDQSGLAKRVALAFDEDPQLDDINTLYVAQTGTTVVLKGQVPNQQILSRMVSVAKGVRGATAVETNQVSIG